MKKNKEEETGKLVIVFVFFSYTISRARQVILLYFQIQEVFSQLPLPYVEEEFKIDLTWKDSVAKDDLPPYVHIRRSILFNF